MKTSNKLLLALFAVVLLTLLGANLPLKRTFDAIDRNDPYFGYVRDTLSSFSYIKLTGDSYALMQIQPGTRFEIRSRHGEPGAGGVNREIRGDTLFIVVRKNENSKVNPWSPNPMEQKPAVYIMAPTLSGIRTEGLLTKVTGWRGGELAFSQKGKSALLTGNQFDQLHISAQAGSSVAVDAKNVVGEGILQVQDSSRMDITKQVFRTFRMQVDSTAHVSLPGSMLR